MPVNAYWDTPDRECLIVELTPPYDWEQFHAHAEAMHRLIAEVSHKVDVILWTVGDPPDGAVLPHLRRVFAEQPANTGQVFVIMNTSSSVQMFARMLASTMQQLFPRKSRVTFVRNVDEARRLMSPRAASV